MHGGLSSRDADFHPFTDFGGAVLGQDALFDEPGAERVDRITLEPLVELALRSIRCRVGPGVAGVAIGLQLEQAGTLPPAASVEGFFDGACYRVDILPIDDHARHPIAHRPIGDVLDGGGDIDAAVLAVLVVLADEDNRQLPDRRQVEALMERADVGRPVAEHRDRRIVGPPDLGGQRSAGRHRNTGSNNGESRQQADRHVTKVH